MGIETQWRAHRLLVLVECHWVVSRSEELLIVTPCVVYETRPCVGVDKGPEVIGSLGLQYYDNSKGSNNSMEALLH